MYLRLPDSVSTRGKPLATNHCSAQRSNYTCSRPHLLCMQHANDASALEHQMRGSVDCH